MNKSALMPIHYMQIKDKKTLWPVHGLTSTHGKPKSGYSKERRKEVYFWDDILFPF